MDVSGFSTFQSMAGKETQNECIKGNSDLITAMEFELLDTMAKRHLNMMSVEIKEKACKLYETEEVRELFDFAKSEGLNSDSICIVFVAIIISQNLHEIGDITKVKNINNADFIRFLKSYLQGIFHYDP